MLLWRRANSPKVRSSKLWKRTSQVVPLKPSVVSWVLIPVPSVTGTVRRCGKRYSGMEASRLKELAHHLRKRVPSQAHAKCSSCLKTGISDFPFSDKVYSIWSGFSWMTVFSIRLCSSISFKAVAMACLLDPSNWRSSELKRTGPVTAIRNICGFHLPDNCFNRLSAGQWFWSSTILFIRKLHFGWPWRYSMRLTDFCSEKLQLPKFYG